MTTFNTSQFSFIRDCFTAEHSSLGSPYTDAIVLKSAKTGTKVRYNLFEIERDAEGDVLCWRFLPAQDCPTSARRTSVIIFND